MRGYQRGIWLQEIKAIRAVRRRWREVPTHLVPCFAVPGRGFRKDCQNRHCGTPSRSRDALRPRFAGNSSPSMVRGRREDRVRAAPAVSCAMCTKSAHTSIQVQRRASGLPCAMALRLIACSPRRTALLPPLRPEKLLPPGALTPAPRRQDHTPSPYA